MTPLRKRVVDLMLSRGYAERTKETYLSAIQRLAAHYHKDPATLTRNDIQNYFLYTIKERHWSPASCRISLNAFRFLYIDILNWNPDEFRFDIPKRKQKIPALLTQLEVEKILLATTNFRQRTLLTLCYGCGLRVSELVKVAVPDIDGERHLLKINQGKGHKDRQIILPDSILTLLRKYWHQRHPQHWLFYTNNILTPISISCVQRYFHCAKKRAGINKKTGIHGLRHAYATHQISHGMPIHALQQQMGHKDIHSTLRYLHWVPHYIEGQYSDLIANIGANHE